MAEGETVKVEADLREGLVYIGIERAVLQYTNI
jgi:hypothetical protein